MLLLDKIKKKHYFFIKKLCIPIFLLTFPKQIKEREETQKDKSVARWGEGGFGCCGAANLSKPRDFLSYAFLSHANFLFVFIMER